MTFDLYIQLWAFSYFRAR